MLLSIIIKVYENPSLKVAVALLKNGMELSQVTVTKMEKIDIVIILMVQTSMYTIDTRGRVI